MSVFFGSGQKVFHWDDLINQTVSKGRWLEAYESGMAPKVYLKRTHQRALEIVPLELLRKFALDLD